ncbi:Uncharacterized membrane protein [Chitinophaga ginsengisegetis]|uniref:Uncharacterized membrane protein n=1 Tax=Chitinophaga ginsengisegetis TaxID=393003 RepID=A0A1T5P4Q8_9BACT|nr:DUF502 domain-containing protein [Chitinophaga ginsengisegetis]MDR6570345.1 putative membrane protein [Chitinophaga ginsengisegetis]MDR6650079.1 putative membrane protein [Chitinophaga ginsengisegetis]MDR6656280.1 putative membrane protein [Chitinophaga ginsengisegetis]SKD07750.1 Uncharacterized membrane protein [Chitinophaga ginsengisegetis]
MSPKLRLKVFASRLLRYFFQGLLILAPIGITALTLYWAFITIDNIIPKELIPEGASFSFLKYKGVGFALVLLLIIVVGYLSSSFIIGRIFDLFDHLLERTPFIKYIYTSIKDVFDAFVGEKKKFDHPVLVQIYGVDVWEMGFITQTDVSNLGLEGYMAVYVPHAYAITGKVFMVPKERVKPLTNVSAGEAMKFAVSGGVTHI